MILYIKNMVCNRCINIIREELENMGIYSTIISLGEITIKEGLSADRLEQFNNAIKKSGFELIDHPGGTLVREIKNYLTDLAHYSNDQMKKSLQEYLSKKLHHDYAFLARHFLEVEGTSIEVFFVTKRIELVKELLIYYRLNLPEIALQLNYNNINQLSGQFKKVTGYSPSHFQKIRRIRDSVQGISA